MLNPPPTPSKGVLPVPYDIHAKTPGIASTLTAWLPTADSDLALCDTKVCIAGLQAELLAFLLPGVFIMTCGRILVNQSVLKGSVRVYSEWPMMALVSQVVSLFALTLKKQNIGLYPLSLDEEMDQFIVIVNC